MNKITEEKFYDLLSLKLSGDATAEDLALLEELLLQNSQWQFLYDEIIKVSPAFDLNDDLDTELAYSAHYVKMKIRGLFDEDAENQLSIANLYETNQKRRSVYRKLIYIGIAASLFAIILYSSIDKNQHSVSKTLASLNEIVTKKGSKTNIKLPDGTKVWLNADSKIVYAESFIGSTREVTLIGEAYFDVVHDSMHPFIIHTGKEDIKVLGTAFNVRNYPSEKMLETTLMRGKIEVTFKGRPDEKIVLKPLEKLIVSKESYTVVNAVNRPNSTQVPENKITLTSATYFTQKDSMVVETAWVNDKMVFINQPLEKIAEELERNFGITVIFKSDIVKGYRYTGVFDNQSLDKVLEIIQLSRKIDYRIIDKKLVIE